MSDLECKGVPETCVGTWCRQWKCCASRAIEQRDFISVTLTKIAENFETRAKQIATHNQRSHTSNTQQRKNMEIMHQIWSDAAAYVRAQAPK